MNKTIKNRLIFSYFFIFYSFALFSSSYSTDGKINTLLLEVFLFISIAFYIGTLIKIRKCLSIYIIIKLIIFSLIILMYFIIEQGIIKLLMYGLPDTSNIIDQHFYKGFPRNTTWYQVIFWNFLFSLHYPIYIFIFLKPFVNHLDKSIKRMEEKENNKLD